MALTDTMPMPVQNVLIDELFPPEDDVREGRDQDHVLALSAEIRRVGFQRAITGVARPAGGVEVVAGWTGVLAARLAELTAIPVMILPKRPDEAGLLQLRVKENKLRRGLTLIEEGTAYARYKLLRGVTTKQLAAEWSVNESDVCKALAVFNDLDESLHKLVASRQLPGSHAYEISHLGKPDQLAVAETVVRQKLTLPQTKQLVRERLNSKPVGRPKQTSTQKIPVSSIAAAKEYLGTLLGKLKELEKNPTTANLSGVMLAKLLEGK